MSTIVMQAAQIATGLQGVSPQNFTPVAPMFSAGAGDAPIEVWNYSESAPTVVAFESFRRSICVLGVNVILVKDILNAAYQVGIPGIGDSVDDVAESIRSLVPKSSRLLGAVASSVGSIGAMMYGPALGVPSIVLLGPRSSLPVDLARRRVEQVAPLLGIEVQELLDLMLARNSADVLRSYDPGGRPVTIRVHVSAFNKSDVEQARRMTRLPRVSMKWHATREHNIAEWLMRQGRLSAIICQDLGLSVSHVHRRGILGGL